MGFRPCLALCAVLLANVVSAPLLHAGESRQVGIDFGTAPQPATRRMALIIGNRAYAKRPLTNTIHDAEAIAAKLRSMGFEVTYEPDLPFRKMNQVMDTYVSDLRRGDVSFFYYSGHGLQIDGENYLIPTDFEATRAEEVKWSAYPIGRLMDGLAARNLQVNVVVLDACRDNPFKATRGAGGGLASVTAGKGSLIAFATSPGSVADDGEPGKHGVFTDALLKFVDAPGRDLEDVFKDVRREVALKTREQQVPWTSSSMVGQFYLQPPSPAVPAVGVHVNLPAGVAQDPGTGGSNQPPATPATVAARGPRLVEIAGGSMTLGCAAGDTSCEADEKTNRTVAIPTFQLAETEVTVAQYRACVTAGVCSEPAAQRAACNWRERPDHPVNCVSWQQASAFCSWAGARLPTADEWEFAARSGKDQRNPWGNAPVTPSHAQFEASGTAPVHTHPQGASAQGVHDLIGNVWEWTATEYAPGLKEARGGSWMYQAAQMRASNRMRAAADDKDVNIGFRCAR